MADKYAATGSADSLRWSSIAKQAALRQVQRCDTRSFRSRIALWLINNQAASFYDGRHGLCGSSCLHTELRTRLIWTPYLSRLQQRKSWRHCKRHLTRQQRPEIAKSPRLDERTSSLLNFLTFKMTVNHIPRPTRRLRHGDTAVRLGTHPKYPQWESVLSLPAFVPTLTSHHPVNPGSMTRYEISGFEVGLEW